MRIHNTLKNTQGFATAYHAAIRFRDMRNKAEVERRIKILTFWQTHGETATRDAFGVSRRSLYRWRSELAHAHGNITALDPKSTAPKRTRTLTYTPELAEAIIRIREEHPRLGPKKLRAELRPHGHIVSVSKLGRIIADLKRRGRIPHRVKLSWYAKSQTHKERHTKPQKRVRRAEKRGIEIDTVVRHIDGRKRYVVTGKDVRNKFAYARIYTTHTSLNARDFLKRLLRHAPFEINEIQTDNGSEFAHLFHDACLTLGITHYHTYPRCPKMNANIERFNRTLSEEFLVSRRALLRDDVDAANEALDAWLYWYNHSRVHESLGLLSPMEYIKKMECQMW